MIEKLEKLATDLEYKARAIRLTIEILNPNHSQEFKEKVKQVSNGLAIPKTGSDKPKRKKRHWMQDPKNRDRVMKMTRKMRRLIGRKRNELAT